MKRLKLFLLAVIVPVLGVAALAPSPLVLAGTATQEACEAIGGNFRRGECITQDSPSVEGIVATVINVLSIIVGIAAVIMIIFGGFRYITAGGDTGKLTAARHTIMYAIVGLVIVALAQFIVQFVVDRATNVPDDASLLVASTLLQLF